MDLKTTLMERKSTRAFLDKEVSMDTINEIIEQSKQHLLELILSHGRLQSFREKVKIISVISLRRLLEAEYKGSMDYKYYPVEWLDEYKQRRKECGLMLYST